jgi:hypothetical protein
MSPLGFVKTIDRPAPFEEICVGADTGLHFDWLGARADYWVMAYLPHFTVAASPQAHLVIPETIKLALQLQHIWNWVDAHANLPARARWLR